MPRKVPKNTLVVKGTRVLRQQVQGVGPQGVEAAREETDTLLQAAALALTIAESTDVAANDTSEPFPVETDSLNRPKKRLTNDEVNALVLRYQQLGDVRARDVIVLGNLGLVGAIMKGYRNNPAVHPDDLEQQGVEGLMRAIETYDPSRGFQFSTYAAQWVRNKIQRYTWKCEEEAVPPLHEGNEYEEQRATRRRRKRERVLSMDSNVDGDEGGNLHDVLATKSETPERLAERAHANQLIRSHVEAVIGGDERVRLIVEERILAVEPLGLTDIAKMIGFSREYVRQLELKIMARFKARLSGEKMPKLPREQNEVQRQRISETAKRSRISTARRRADALVEAQIAQYDKPDSD